MRLLPAGIYTPLPCFFHDNEDLGMLQLDGLKSSWLI